jgi:hypothetical protein
VANELSSDGGWKDVDMKGDKDAGRQHLFPPAPSFMFGLTRHSPKDYSTYWSLVSIDYFNS